MRVLILGSAVLSLVTTDRFIAPAGVLGITQRISDEVVLSPQNNCAFQRSWDQAMPLDNVGTLLISLSHTPVINGRTPRLQTLKKFTSMLSKSHFGVGSI
ncbi:hypothetical protein AVEN_78010-1 [Araneus ventricosus]|uniref:Uncharacterized protein n=1 Tax=Araneus ventricosus TaxID=182803 RepID=A0A4Y2V9G8_ARAVE|nr:hypothetical protein AVEN_78010-1 [Araneus ventricosus]